MTRRPVRRGHVCPTRPAAALVQFAMVASVFVMFVLGIMELGRVLMAQHLMTNAARQACRVGIIGGTSTATIKSVATQALKAQGIPSTVASVQVNDGSIDALSAKSGDEITVIITVPMKTISWVPVPFFSGGTLKAQYSLRRE